MRIRGLAVALIFIQSVLVECSIILWPALPLLLVPRARGLFLRISAWGQAAWLGLAVGCLRLCGTRIYIHCKGLSLKELQQFQGDQLLLSNHPSRIDWMYHWSLAIAMGRLPKLKIVLKDSLRVAPGFGWAMQCNAYPFLNRRRREQDLQTLHSVGQFGGGLTLLLFPEGTDLSDSNLRKSHAHAEKENLPKYHEVLHPRTAGFDAAWSSMKAAAAASAAKPRLLDVTVAYVDFVPGQLPNEMKLFARGEAPREVHLLVQAADVGLGELWSRKEEVLSKFYGPCKHQGQRSGSGQLPDVSALAAEQSCLWEDVPGVRGRLAASCLVALGCEAIACYALWKKPLIACGLFASSCATFLALQKLAGGVDQVILQPGRAKAQ